MMRVLFVLLMSVAVATGAIATEPEKPNILFILSDDLGYGDLPCYGNPYLETPALDQLAGQGVRLTAHYAPSPLCAPSRAGFLTGRFNHRTGAIDVSSNRGIDRIALSEKTFGDYFGHAGYATALIGKWHNGIYCRDYLPHHRGFDLFYGFPNGAQDYWRWNLLRNDAADPHDGRYLTDAINDEAIDFIRGHQDQPFALFLAHHAPHTPLQAPQRLVDKYRGRLDGVRDESVAIVYAMIEAMDRGLGRVFETLKTEGLWENTLVVFTSDNGAQLRHSPRPRESQRRFHAGLSGNKGDVGEQGIRVPAIVAWPGHLPAGTTIATPVHGCDWLPTLYSLTGSGPPDDARPLDGTNVMPLLRGEAMPELADRVLPFQKNRYTPVAHSDAAIRRGKWKLRWPGAGETMQKDIARDNPSFERGRVRPHWEMPLDPDLPEYRRVQTPAPQLFNLAADRAEQQDVAGRHPEVVRELSRRYNAWFEEVFSEWQQAHRAHIEHDRDYWARRPVPDPRKLFADFWRWDRAPKGTDPDTADPLKIFRGYWNVDSHPQPN